MSTTHEQKETIQIDWFIPDHEERTESAEFRKSRPLVIARDKGCVVCGSQETLEAHHFLFEWCEANGIDRDQLVNYVDTMHAFFANAKEALAQGKTVEQLVDSPENLITLCKEHHTGKDTGIHALPYPIWVMQWLAKEGYKFSPTEIVSRLKK